MTSFKERLVSTAAFQEEFFFGSRLPEKDEKGKAKQQQNGTKNKKSYIGAAFRAGGATMATKTFKTKLAGVAESGPFLEAKQDVARFIKPKLGEICSI